MPATIFTNLAREDWVGKEKETTTTAEGEGFWLGAYPELHLITTGAPAPEMRLGPRCCPW
jgi:hypothetical protein